MYRDSFDKCPRCGVELVDARSARGCRACGGLWLEEAVLTEMILTMLPPRPLSRLVLAVIERTEAPLGCPTCGDAMELTSIHEVSVDRCGKHGIWFDALELQAALQRVAHPERKPPLELVDDEPPPVPPPAPSMPHVVLDEPLPRPRSGARPVQELWPLREVELVFRVHAPGRDAREVRIRDQIVKIGRGPGSHLLIDTDDRVHRMHAVIEVAGPGEVSLIDLGSKAGTRVNGKRIEKAKLDSGDVIEVGSTLIHVTMVKPSAG